MPSHSDCPFCRIADGDPDGQVLARAFGCMIFAPLNPVTDGHALVVPEVHVEHFAQNPAVSGAAMMAAAAWVGDGDFNVITSKGPAATQTVKHLHLHLVPRRAGDGLALPWTAQEVQESACTTFDCGRLAVSMVEIEDQGEHPYCGPCAAILTQHERQYGEHLRNVAADVREWGDATPERVRKRCLAAEAEIERLRETLREVRARWGYARWGYPKLIAVVDEALGDA